MTYHHQHLHYLVPQHDEERWDCAATLVLLTVSTTVHHAIAPSRPTNMQSGGSPSASATPSSRKRTNKATTVNRLAELARERKELSKMVSVEAQRFNAFYAHTQARVLANKKAYLEELQHHRQVCNEKKQAGSRNEPYKKQRSASRGDEAAAKESWTSLMVPCESADDEASQQTGSTTPHELFAVAESRKRKRRGGQPLRARGDYSDVEEEALLATEGPDDSEDEPEEEQDEEYQGVRNRRTKRTKFDVNWDKRFDQLVEYYNEYGNALIPQKWRENPTLGKWASNQRYQLAKHRLDPLRYARLDQLGFWDTKFSSSRAKGK